MKSLALNLFKIILLLLGALVVTVNTTTITSSSSAISLSSQSSDKTFISATRRAVPTTTPIPPSLQAPPKLQLRRHTLPATIATTTTTAKITETIATATSKPSSSSFFQMASNSYSNSSNSDTNRNSGGGNRRQRLSTARHAAKQITTTTTSTSTKRTTIMSNSKRKPIISETSTLASTRLVRNVDATTSVPVQAPALQNAVRQQRSFYSNGAQPYEDTNTKRKFKTLERRYYDTTRSPLFLSTTTTATMTTTTTTGKPQTHAGDVVLRHRTASLPPRYDKTNLNRQQSKASSSSLSSLPLDENNDDRKAIATTLSVKNNDNNHNGKKILTSFNNQQTPKTPRMIQRLVAGHIQNAEGRTRYQVSSVTTNSTVSNSTIPTKISSTIYGPRRPTLLSSSYRDTKLNANIRVASTTPSPTTTSTPTSIPPTAKSKDVEMDYHDDDEALLDDSSDLDNWDNGILRLSAGSGKENNLKSKKSKADSKKTLADQVRDGKYGLIEKELFRRTPKRPGILSYLPNKEVPEDNERNLGGLNEEDIWLAEDHLLVIKGGSLNEDNPEEPWPAIDDYNVAGRQIKIPSNPKIPPPFPVQLEENGPVQLIGNNKLTVVYPLTNESIPVYTVGSQAHNTPPSDDSDDEKNFITRPGKTKTVKENQPVNNYPPSALPWLYNNQTLANPPLNANAKPINFPVLGPFLYGRNGSLDNLNGTEDFDEDDPSLYYPPAYTFVYKNNYTNPVPPGPLVPGIVVPPPPDQFSKLEKTEKERRPWYSSTQSPPIRYRVYSTTAAPTVTTTIATTTTTTTLEPPFRQVVTKISEYIPKVINIVTPAPRPVYTPTQPSRYSLSPSSTPPSTKIEPIPVPVAVPIPIYTVNTGSNARPEIVSFVPTTPESNVETLSKANPIYYEYFEAKRQQGGTNAIEDFLSTTSKPSPSAKPIKLYATSKRPFKPQNHHRHYLPQVTPNNRYVEENVVVITPRPEFRYKPRPIYKQRPLQNFEQEVDAIRETLRYYQNQELRDNNIPRTPKAKPVFDYNFEGSKTDLGSQFQPPAEYDGEPFKPMVTYSPAVNDENAFKALPVDKVVQNNDQPQGREDFAELPKYPTTTLLPVQPQGRPKKLRIGAKYLQQPPASAQQQEFFNPPREQPHWLAVNKQELNDYSQAENPPQRERFQEPLLSTRQREYPGYYYGPGRQNNRFYEEPFQNIPSRKIINYRPQHQPQQQPQQIWSLQNDTLVNELPNRPPINPDAEFIDPYLVGPSGSNYPFQRQRLAYQPQQQAQQQLPQSPPLPISHQSQYYGRPLYQRLPSRQYLQTPPLQRPQQQPPAPPFSLINDELVNYRQPLPPINPDSEWISHPQVVRNPPQQQFFRSNNYRLPLPPQTPPLSNGGVDADVYYLTPKYRRANNLNNKNSGNNNRYQQQQSQQQDSNNNGNGK